MGEFPQGEFPGTPGDGAEQTADAGAAGDPGFEDAAGGPPSEPSFEETTGGGQDGEGGEPGDPGFGDSAGGSDALPDMRDEPSFEEVLGAMEDAMGESGRGNETYRCPKCKLDVPPMYVRGYAKYPPVVGSAVGFTGHGKTVYLASLMHELRGERLAKCWPRFHNLALNDESLTRVVDNMTSLRNGILPEATPVNLEAPTLLRLSGVPKLGSVTLCVYDVSGEVFRRGTTIGKYAPFVAKAKTVLLLISMAELDDYLDRMQRQVTG